MTDHVIDVKNKSLGRVASEIAVLLQGKDTPDYNPRKVGSNRVVIKNIKLLKVTGRKADQKTYYRHTGYMGHLRSKTYKEAFAKNPEWVLRHAVLGMLPKNFLRSRRIKFLVFDEVKDNG